ncbi:CPBP family intramembrane metalloprotease [Marinicella sp. S1101]|uniref:CPBP family intramembrane glutamic endopeptidase n=1 Tax=Marinicella marina TaxID=2996016 RepID=UPI002260B8A7|nr:CPBP family intramembrane glutamic endopeptidase [Marinicella marina]MCX7553541.1 CPBP family intramembrane metalloprotease [Marinicella marina]MDJ1140165.1 CPBP family intramembrane metalloprotease [Marinicella marina]
MYPLDSTVTPNLLIHGSSLLLVVLLVKKFTNQIKNPLLLKAPDWTWVLIAVAVAVLYWGFDHWMMHELWQIDSSVAIKTWQSNNMDYLPLSVLISTVLLAPAFEEILFRGVVFNQLNMRLNSVIAASFSAGFFALIHWSWPAFISLFFAGLLYAWLLARAKSLWIPMLAHVVHNLMTYLVFIGQ